jgi:activator of 2-hydroxyglutaryl-CoA dehydratase
MNGSILGHAVIKAKSKPEESAADVMDLALKNAGLKMEDISFCVGTVTAETRFRLFISPYRDCLSRQRRAVDMPSVRTVIDIGGQDCKAMRNGQRRQCAEVYHQRQVRRRIGTFSGSDGQLLGVSLDALGTFRKREGPAFPVLHLYVWVQAEVVHHLNSQKPVADIAAAINRAMAIRVAILANQIKAKRISACRAGVAKK